MPVHANGPFRADHVGSLLRPPPLSRARRARAAGELSAEALREAENTAIIDAIRLQEDVGLPGITDGEFRRTHFHTDFLEQIGGIRTEGGIATRFHKADGDMEFAPPRLVTDDTLRHERPIMRGDYEFIAAHTRRTPKITLPAPSMAHFRGGREAVSRDAYPQMERFFDDLAEVYRQEVNDLAAAGCRYIQFDDTNLAYLCDPELREAARRRGEDPDALPRLYADLLNRAIADRPADMRVTIHLCRGNFRSAWVAEGGYDPVAETMFGALKIDGYFLEFDDARSGGFAPLRFAPPDTLIVLGLVSSKRAEMESRDDMLRRIDEAANVLDADQLGISAQCGFSSTEHGNDIDFDTQRRKLELVVDLAETYWGAAAA